MSRRLADAQLNDLPLAGAIGCEDPANSRRSASETALPLTAASRYLPLSPASSFSVAAERKHTAAPQKDQDVHLLSG